MGNRKAGKVDSDNYLDSDDNNDDGNNGIATDREGLSLETQQIAGGPEALEAAKMIKKHISKTPHQ